LGALAEDRAVGVPAWLAVIRLVAESYALAPLIVYRGASTDDRERARDTWQWRLLHLDPGDGRTAFGLLADIGASLAAQNNAYLVKAKYRGEVRELVLRDPRKVRPRREGARILYEDRTDPESPRTWTRDEMIHIRGLALNGAIEGVSPIRALRMTLANSLMRQMWERSYLRNEARPGVALKFPQGLSAQEAREFRDVWDEAHAGVEQAGRTGVIGGGGDLAIIPPISLTDAQFVEAQRLSLQQIAGLYRVPVSFVGGEGGGNEATTEQDALRLATYALGPMFAATEQALSRDPDLFPPRSGLFVEHLPDALVRPDLKTRYDAYRLARQGGWQSPNEIRRRENLPPVDGGDEIQMTPVGGAPNAPGRNEED
jgi:HK97 family phage portal protein